MRNFKYIDDFNDWLAPMDYQGFWCAIAPFNLPLQDRQDCDRQLANGSVTLETMLIVLKGFAEIEMARKHVLNYRPATPWLKLVDAH